MNAVDSISLLMMLFYLIGILGVLVVIPIVAYFGLRDRKKTQAMCNSHCPKCFYNLAGTLAADGTHCPECGEPIRYKPGVEK